MSFHRVKIVQPGWDGFSGHMASVEFENGVSKTFVPENLVDRIAAEVKVVDADTGADLGVQHRMIASQCLRLDETAPLARAPESEPEPQVVKAALVTPETEGQGDATTPEVDSWTQEKLEAVADDKGIKGLREIGDPLGAKGRSIPELIENIIRTQAEISAKAAAALKREG